MLRDVQTLSIWEGTTNVLSLDMLRAAEKENGMQAFRHFADTFLQQVNRPALDKQKQLLRQKTEALFSFIQQIKNPEALVAASRDISYYIAETTIALLWLDLLNKSDTACNAQYVNALNYWIHLKMNESSLRAAATLEIT
jgi:hypothetical protein